jgi:dihydrofolate reductase
MFGPIRGEWDTNWTGWWGDEPPYHAPVFVLTHHPREPLTMQGGTTYLAAGLIDELHTHIAPVTVGAGERLFDGVPPPLGASYGHSRSRRKQPATAATTKPSSTPYRRIHLVMAT